VTDSDDRLCLRSSAVAACEGRLIRPILIKGRGYIVQTNECIVCHNTIVRPDPDRPAQEGDALDTLRQALLLIASWPRGANELWAKKVAGDALYRDPTLGTEWTDASSKAPQAKLSKTTVLPDHTPAAGTEPAFSPQQDGSGGFVLNRELLPEGTEHIKGRWTIRMTCEPRNPPTSTPTARPVS